MSLDTSVALTVVVPAYNEELVLESTLRDILGYCKKKFPSYEVIVVDDGSQDRTVSIARSFSGVRVIRLAKNRGKGRAVREGVLASRGQYILFMDADNSTNIRELNHFMQEIRDYDIVIGSRALAASSIMVSQNIVKSSLGKLGNRVIRLMLGLRINDTRCGFKLFRSRGKEIFEKQVIDRWGFDDEILFLAQRARMTVYESPVTWVNNFASKVRARDYLRALVDLARIKLRAIAHKY